MEKIHIAITGRTNTGKSSLINCIIGQSKSIVSAQAGTTTDPVKKSYEIPGTASVTFIDTPGIDDHSELGKQRIEKTMEAIHQSDATILVISDNCFNKPEIELIETFQSLGLPFLILHNRSDLVPLSTELQQEIRGKYKKEILSFSIPTPNRSLLIEEIIRLIDPPTHSSLLGNIIQPGQIIMLVTPIDSEAPTGRMILPQMQLLRDILDNRCISIVLQPEEIPAFLAASSFTPHLVVTDSQAFGKVAPLIPSHIPLTGFSILFARHKGNFEKYLEGTPAIDRLKDGDRILMLESCAHHISCEDIGRIKIPALLRKHTGKELEFDYIAGLDKIKRPFSAYSLIIQCGGCMVTSRQLHNRLQPAINQGVPVSNYGMTIAWIQGIFARVTAPLKK